LIGTEWSANTSDSSQVAVRLGGCQSVGAARADCARRDPITGAAPRHYKAHRNKTVVGLRDREGAQFVALRQLPHRRQQRARAQRLRFDRAREALHHLLDERRRGAPVALQL
jgi:hypothetical protein